MAQAQLLYPYADAERVLWAWREVALRAPDTVAPEFVLWSVPPDPGIPAALHGSKVVVVAGVFAGPPNEATPALAPLRELGTPLLDLSGVMPYVQVQSALDDLVPPGGRYYMKSHFMNELTDEAIAALLDCDTRRPNPETLIVIRTLGGAIDRVGPGHNAYPHRAARFNLSIDPLWSDPALDDAAIGWARSTWNTLRPFATGGVYVNFAGLDDEAGELRDGILGTSRDRLDSLRAAYDPDGLFDAAAHQPCGWTVPAPLGHTAAARAS